MSDDDVPFKIDDVKANANWWPSGPDRVRKMIKNETCGVIRIGRCQFVTRRLLRDALARLTTEAK